MDWPPRIGDLLPRAIEAVGVHEKLATYCLAPAHRGGGEKARGFELALGITVREVDYLEQAIRRGIMTHPIASIRPNPIAGVNCVVEFPISGVGRYSDRRVDLRTVWQIPHLHGQPRLITAFPRT